MTDFESKPPCTPTQFQDASHDDLKRSGDPLPKLIVSGCTVYYDGKPIYEAASLDHAIEYRDSLINSYM
jgi:hypothetical protein